MLGNAAILRSPLASGCWDHTPNRDLNLQNHNHAVPAASEAQAILIALKEQLAALDSAGLHIAAAHLDAAIQRLRADINRA